MNRAIQGIANIEPGIRASQSASVTGDSSEFLNTLQSAMDQVGQIQSDAQSSVVGMLRGDGGDVHSAMIAMEKADLSFQLMMQVRNKIIQAYQEVSRMPF